MPTTAKIIDVKSALLANGWAQDVRISIGLDGGISAIEEGAATLTRGCLLPGIANLHSHAHQRAMAGLAEKSGSSGDSFWTWRKTMYRFIDAMQPHHLYDVASQLYLELLSAGYTRVAEFQYLHHQSNGQPYENMAEMSLQTLQAARAVGIGITSLPVHYQFGGFGEQPVREQQKRFNNQPSEFLKIVEILHKHLEGDQNNNLGVAGHSLRATSVAAFSEILQSGLCIDNPIHMHVAEQSKEVDDCLAWSGARPVEYCLENFNLDDQWCLIHATHMNESETSRLASSGAVVGICPTTEANLGDGLFNANMFLAKNGVFGIGSDSHISTSLVEELRWFEYGQRLKYQSRNQLTEGAEISTGRKLFDWAVAGGAQACAHHSAKIEVGARADFIILDEESPNLVERENDEILDSWIFSGNHNAVRDVYVGGKKVISDGVHAEHDQIKQRFRRTMRELKSHL